MRIANVAGRAKLLVEGGALDVATASGGAFGPDPLDVYDSWDAFRAWAETAAGSGGSADNLEPWDPAACGAPSPSPRQVFAVALNYADHAAESGMTAPEAPLIFPKYVSAFTGPVSEVVLPDGRVDWECELVAIIGRTARRVDRADGWSCVAGVTVGQDISERVLQRSGGAPQFGLAKSHTGFAPQGPALVTVDELPDPDDLGIGCEVNGHSMQKARTSDMVHSVPALVAFLSSIVTLYPGDVIFTGTPPGVGAGRRPPVFLGPGDRLHSWIEGVGEMDQTFVAG